MTIRKPSDQKSGDTAQTATTRKAKGSIQEAIGKLIGDDDVRRRGAAEKQAGADAAADDQQDSRS